MKRSVASLALALTAIIIPTRVFGSVSSANAGDCLCATTTVNARSQGSLSGTVVTQLSTGECGQSLGKSTYSNGYQWFQLTFENQNVWVAGNFLNKRGSSSTSSSSCPRIVSRCGWSASQPKGTKPMPQPASYVFIHHSDTPTCSSESACAARVKNIQYYHMTTEGWDDIGYSFLIGGDGTVFEGRGWENVGAHTEYYNSQGYGICFIGTFNSVSPTSAQVQSAKNLIACGVADGKISSTYKLRGHKDMKQTDCPGTVLYNLIKTWPHY